MIASAGMNVLFVCTANVARSRVAAALFRELAGPGAPHAVRSAGTAPDAARRLTTRDMAWADVVVVMEPAHLALIRRWWPGHAAKARVLGIPDDYDPDEPALREALAPRLQGLLDELATGGRPP